MPTQPFTVPRGMKDIEPQEMSRRLWIYDRIREVVTRYGFRMVEPTPIENLKTLEAKSGPTIRKEIYWFRDKAGRNLGLRFDLTVGLARMIANRFDLPEPIKFATIGGNWRYDEPQFGRYRYFTQWDVEIFGSASPLADAEAICVGADILESVGLKDYVIRISNRKLTESYLKQIGVRPQGKVEQTLRIIDKIRKGGREQLEREFRALRISKGIVVDIFAFISLNGAPAAVLKSVGNFDLRDENAIRGVEELQILSSALEASGRLPSCVYDLSIVRGIGYYDGIVFEAFDKAGEDLGSIFGGGRYDRLCQIYGKRNLPATGVAGGIERLMISLERAGLFPATPDTAKVFIAVVQPDLAAQAIQLARQLRDNSLSTEVDLMGRSLGKQLKYADSLGIPFVIVLGKQEVESGIVRVKDMRNGQETEVSMNALAEKLKTLG